MTKNKREIERAANRRSEGRTANGFLHALLALLIVLLGIAGAITFIKLKKPPERAEKDVQAPLVKVEQLRAKDIPMVVRGYGVVNPKVEVDIVPEVAGKVVSIHPECKVGGLIRAGEQILQIDSRDYESAVRQAAAAVEDAKVKLDTEEAEADVAREEWSDLHPGVEPTSALVLREPQIRKARAALESAEAQLATAKLRLERTRLSLPFNALIVSEKVDLGQYVVAGQSLAKAYGTQAVEIEVPLEDDELAWFNVFDDSIFSNENRGAAGTTPAEVRANFAGAEHIWQGRVVRTTGQVDRTSRMVFIVVEVSNPLRVSGGRPPLLPGVFAEVLIEGKILAGALAVPRDAIREGNQVWLVNGDRLHIQSLDVVRANKDFAYVVSGVEDGALVVTSSLDAAVDDMKVRLQNGPAAGAGQSGQDASEPNKQEQGQ